MTTSHVLIIGGSSGIGLALAERLLGGGAVRADRGTTDRGTATVTGPSAPGVQVTIAGRSTDRLAAAVSRLGHPGRVQGRQVDITREDQIRRLMTEAGPLNHVVVTAADAAGAYAPVTDVDVNAARALIDAKVVGPLLVAKLAAPHLAPNGSITFTSGIAAYRPGPGAATIAAANGALEALVRALALELAPIRVNVVSPGWIDTPIWDTIAGDRKDERLAAMAGRLPAGRIGHPADIAKAFIALMDNGFITATLLHVDGGHRLV